MELLLIPVTICSVVTLWKVFRGPKPQAPKALEARSEPDGAVEGHTLVRTWIGSGNNILLSWRWECSCGTKGYARDLVKGKSPGSEANAIQQFKAHAKNYQEANGNKWKSMYEAKSKEFEEYKEKCYCKDIH